MLLVTSLHALRMRQKASLPFLESAEDLDIVLEIGRAQEAGSAIGVNSLLSKRLGSPATIMRRLLRLRQLGVIKERPVRGDARRRDLFIAAAARRRLETFARALNRAPG
jgi:hypothetical protein